MSLHDFVVANRQTLIDAAVSRIHDRSTPTQADEVGGIPIFLDQLIERLRTSEGLPRVETIPSIEDTAVSRGRSYARPDMASRIVHDYGAICESVTELAHQRGEMIPPKHFQVFNMALDDAIAGALTSYTAQRDARRDQEEAEDVGVLAHELRNSLSAIMLAFKVLQNGTVPTSGRTTEVIMRNLERAQRLIDGSLAGVRLAHHELMLAPCSVEELLDDVGVAASAEADRRKLRFFSHAMESQAPLIVDRHLNMSALSNLVQNAMKFTREGGTVTLCGKSNEMRAVLWVADECGGLPPGAKERIFRPFVQSGDDRSGVGLGLTIADRAVRAHGGTLSVHDHPGRGCCFQIDLPRLRERASSRSEDAPAPHG